MIARFIAFTALTTSVLLLSACATTATDIATDQTAAAVPATQVADAFQPSPKKCERDEAMTGTRLSKRVCQ